MSVFNEISGLSDLTSEKRHPFLLDRLLTFEAIEDNRGQGQAPTGVNLVHAVDPCDKRPLD